MVVSQQEIMEVLRKLMSGLSQTHNVNMKSEFVYSQYLCSCPMSNILLIIHLVNEFKILVNLQCGFL